PRLQAAGRQRKVGRRGAGPGKTGRRPDRGALPGRHILRGGGYSEPRALAETGKDQSNYDNKEEKMSQKKPRLAVPAGAVDTHMHVYHAEVPPQPGGPPLPGDYREEKYRAMRDALGFQRV